MAILRELLPTVLGFLVLAAYHIRLFILLQRRPDATSIGLANNLRVLWVAEMMRDGKRDVIPVQTLRNLTMAASFLASTAIIIGLAVFNAALAIDTLPTLPHLSQMVGLESPLLWTIKLFILSGDFFFCFYNFMLAIRYYNHTALLINVPLEHHSRGAQHRPGFLIRMPPRTDVAPGIKMVADLLNQGAAHYTLGMRGYYFVVPLSMWLLGGPWLMLNAFLLVLVLYRIDSPG
jgi:uncharacterized membrane protein